MHTCPLPAETWAAAAYIRDTPPATIIKVWEAQPAALDELAHGCKLAQSKWNACIPEEIPTSSGKFQTAARKQLMNQLGMGGSVRLGQFAFGFPIAGPMSQKYICFRRIPLNAPAWQRIEFPTRQQHGSEKSGQIWPQECSSPLGRGRASGGTGLAAATHSAIC